MYDYCTTVKKKLVSVSKIGKGNVFSGNWFPFSK